MSIMQHVELDFTEFVLFFVCSRLAGKAKDTSWPLGGPANTLTATMAEDADMRNELEEMQQRADQMTDEVRHMWQESLVSCPLLSVG